MLGLWYSEFGFTILFMVDFDRDYYLLRLPLFIFGDFREVAQTEMSDVSPSMCLQTILVEAGPPMNCPPINLSSDEFVLR